MVGRHKNELSVTNLRKHSLRQTINDVCLSLFFYIAR